MFRFGLGEFGIFWDKPSSFVFPFGDVFSGLCFHMTSF